MSIAKRLECSIVQFGRASRRLRPLYRQSRIASFRGQFMTTVKGAVCNRPAPSPATRHQECSPCVPSHKAARPETETMFASSLEALPVHDGGAGLVVLLLGDPHLLEGGQGGQDGPADPDGVLALRGSNDLDLHRGGGKGGDF